MSEPSNSIFSQKALDRMYSADNLNKALRISSPGSYIILAGCAILLVGFLIWGFFGTVVSTVSVDGVVMNGQIHCFQPDVNASGMAVGSAALADKTPTSVMSISNQPLSKSETYKILQSSYLVDLLHPEKWAYHIVLDASGALMKEGQIVHARIITKRVPPIRLIMGGED